MGNLLSLQPTFTQGLVLGQLSIFLLLILVLKYLFLSSQPAPANHLPTPIPPRPPKHETTTIEDDAESSEWLNLILREVVQTYRSELRESRAGPEGDESARSKIEQHLNQLRPSALVGPIIVHSVDLGSSAPCLYNARTHATGEPSEAQQIEFDMTYSDTTSISFSTSVLFNYPLPCFARLPVSLALSLSSFSSKIHLTPASPTRSLTVSFPPQFTLNLHISSLLGSRAKLADVPKLHDMIESQIKRVLAERGTWTIVLPSLTRPQSDADTCGGDEIDVKSNERPLENIHATGLNI